MPDDPTISPDPPRHPSMDFARLRAEGIAHLQALSGETWTDHNTHDPGITILEALCYAITDLGYRTQTALDAMADEGEGGPVLPEGTVPRPRVMLPSHPLTRDDFRKVLLDWRENPESGAERLRDAWVEPWRHEKGETTPCGIYRVALEFQTRNLNHFIYLQNVKDERGTIGGPGVAADQTMTILGQSASGEEITEASLDAKGEFPFEVRGEQDIEISFPRWDSLSADPEWFDPEIDFSGTPSVEVPLVEGDSSGSEPSRSYVGKVKATLMAKEVEFDIHVRFLSDVAKLPNIGNAVRLSIEHAAKAGVFKEFKKTMERVAILRRQIAAHLERHRNLCEFFPLSTIGPMPVDELGVEAVLRIAAGADKEKLAQEFRRRIDDIFTPQIHLRSPVQKVRAGMALPDAWEGPPLTHFDTLRDGMKTTDYEPPESLCAADVIRLLMEIEGVRAVELTRLSLFTDASETLIFADGTASDEIQPIAAGRRMRLSILESRTHLSARRVDEHGNLGAEEVISLGLEEDKLSADFLELSFPEKHPAAPFPWEALGEYQPIEKELPAAYGLKAATIPGEPANPREAKARQLRGYLAFFDQSLANAFAQLAATPELLAFNGSNPQSDGDRVRKTWFTQRLGGDTGSSLPNMQAILMEGSTLEDLSRAGIEETEVFRLQAVLRTFFPFHFPLSRPFNARAERLIDHLLSRHGMTSTLGLTEKQELLEALPQDSMARGAPAGMQRRIAHLAGVDEGDILVAEPLGLAFDGDNLPSDGEIAVNKFRLIIAANQAKFGNRKAQFEALAQREAPAHLVVEVLWCDPDFLKEIRKEFEAWSQATDKTRPSRLELAASLQVKLGNAIPPLSA